MRDEPGLAELDPPTSGQVDVDPVVSPPLPEISSAGDEDCIAVIAPPLPEEEIPRTLPERCLELAQRAVPFWSSAAINLSFLLVLALIFEAQQIREWAVHTIEAVSFLNEPQESEVTTLEASSFFAASEAAEFGNVELQSVEGANGLFEGMESSDSIEPAELWDAPAAVSTAPLMPGSKEWMQGIAGTPRRASPSGPPTERQLGAAKSVGEAVARLTSEIAGVKENGDLQIVWLLDQSLSLLDDRKEAAEYLENFFDTFEARRPKGAPMFLNSAVGFGAGHFEALKRTGQAKRVCHTFKTLPIDPTGLENVFSAIGAAVYRYRKDWRHQLMFVVWTDESGDDIGLLESTIDICRQYDVPVHVVGPSAVLGAEIGYQAYVHPANKRTYNLPVKRGPDVAVPDRLLLPYMAQSIRLEPPKAGEVGSDLPAWINGWQGGPHAAALLSGVPPYALFRLTRETGGTYTIYDRPADRSPFPLDVLRPYLPSYDRADVIIADINEHPLRRKIVETTVNFERARLAMHDHFEAYGFYDQWMSGFQPMAYKRLYVKRGAVLERLLDNFGPEGNDALYEAETAPRWRALHDLTRGRLLAQTVRYAEIISVCNYLQAGPRIPPGHDRIFFVIDGTMKSGPKVKKRLDEAERLLKRCIQEHPRTPWAWLAEKELTSPVSLDYRTYQAPPPVPVNYSPAPAGPSISLPSL